MQKTTVAVLLTLGALVALGVLAGSDPAIGGEDPVSEKQDFDARLRKAYDELQAKQAELNALLRSRGPEDVEDYVLQGPDGEVRLSELFGDSDDLMVVHNMGSSCPYCTLWADGFNGVLHHLENRTALVVVSPDTPGQQKEFADSRGWGFRMISSAGSSFTADMGYQSEHEGQRYALPGFSTFRKSADGKIVRIAHSPFGPGDMYCGVWHLFALLDEGVNQWQPKFRY